MMRTVLCLLLIMACSPVPSKAEIPTDAPRSDLRVATFAGGCFWCMETAFEGMKGVHSVISGYMGGVELNPTYKQVSRGLTGHAEVVQVTYDPNQVTYELLLTTFWYNVDPFAVNQQFCDKGSQYRSGIFFHDAAQERAAKASAIDARKRSQIKGAFNVEITSASTFYRAEEYHQDYYLKNPIHYKRYRYGCGRDRRLNTIWGRSIQGPRLQESMTR